MNQAQAKADFVASDLDFNQGPGGTPAQACFQRDNKSREEERDDYTSKCKYLRQPSWWLARACCTTSMAR